MTDVEPRHESERTESGAGSANPNGAWRSPKKTRDNRLRLGMPRRGNSDYLPFVRLSPVLFHSDQGDVARTLTGRPSGDGGIHIHGA